MTGLIPLLHIEPDPQTAEFIHHTLEQAGYAVTSVRSGKEGLIAAWRDQPKIIVSEFELPDIDGFELVIKLRKDHRTEKTRIVVLTKLKDPSPAVRAKESGVDRYFVKQPDAVNMLLEYLAQGEAPEDEPLHDHLSFGSLGQITALLGIKGGVGTSSLALNIAHHLGLSLGEGRVLAIDFDLPVGSLTFISGVKAKLTLDQLLVQQPQALGSMPLRDELTIPKAWSCAVLPGFKHPVPMEDWTSSNIPALLQVLRSLYEHLVIDLGRDFNPPGQAILAQADHILLIMPPDQESVTRAKSVFNYLKKLGTDSKKIQFVTNRPSPTESLTAGSTEKALGHSVLGAIPYMGDEVTLINTLHAPIALRFPEARGNVIIKEVAKALIGENILDQTTESQSL